MALLKYEGFDNESGASDLYAGILSTLIVSGSSQSASISLSSTTQYNVGQCLGITATSAVNGPANAYAIITIAPVTNNVIVAAAVSLSATVTNGAVIGYVNANVGQLYCLLSAGSLKVFRGDPTGVSVQLGSTVNSVTASLGWAFVELQAVIAGGSSGSVNVQINGINVFTLTGVNTSADSTTSVSGIMLGTANTAQTSGGFTSFFDDVYAIDSSGSPPNNTFLGPVRVITEFPIGNGLSTNFTGLAHHPNYQNVNEVGMDLDATYNYSNVTGNLDTFIGGSLPSTTSQVFAVKIKAAGRIDDSGVRSVQTYLKSGAAVATGASINLVGSYQYFSDIYTADPNTSNPWSASSVNLVQFGYRIVPSPGSTTAIAFSSIGISAIGALNQISAMAVVGRVGPISLLGNLTNVTTAITASPGFGPVASVASFLQVDYASGGGRIGPVAFIGTASSGLFLSATMTLPLFATNVILAQRVTASATPQIMITGTAIINQGLGMQSKNTIVVSAVITASQKVLTSAAITIPLQAVIISTQNIQTSSIIGIGSISAKGTAATANASNIHIGLPTWQINHSYTIGQRVASTYLGVTNAYQATSSGLSSATPPNGTGTTFPDGTLTWKFLSHVDFTDLTTWAASLPATLTAPVVGFLWNNGTITTTAGTPFLTLGSSSTQHVTSAINTITLKPAPGESIRDTLATGTVALAFNTTNGVSFTLPSGTGGVNYFDIYDSNVIFDGLQFRDPNSTSGSTILQQENTSTKLTVRNCIFDGYAQPGGAVMIQGGTGAFTLANALVIDRQASSPDLSVAISTQSTATRLVNVTLVAPNAPGSTGAGILANSAAAVITNTIISGYVNPQAVIGAGGPIASVSYSLFSNTTVGQGAVDNGNNLFSKTASNQFVSATTDFRLKTGADAINTATAALGDIPTADDIGRNPRPNGVAWDIGAWEK
jgi:hypothetical protein